MFWEGIIITASLSSRWLTLLAGLAIICIAWFVYAPGLHGAFLFDDFANLPSLGASGPIDNWPAFWRYITSGTADPTGRPLSLLSFLIDAQDWPASPYPFKRTGLILHLLNGTLLALLLRQLGLRLFSPTVENQRATRQIEAAAVLGGAFWLLHPLLVSTTLYVVQREAMLPFSFAMIGALCWLKGRDAASRNDKLRAWLWLITGLPLCTLLGILCKANGILLPALILLIECFIPQRPTLRSYRVGMTLFAVVPTLFVFAYLAYEGWHGIFRGISAVRPWTLVQRLMTEPRVLMQYLDLLWLPRPYTTGLFNDQVHASTSLISPITTLISLICVAALIAMAIKLRRTRPALALAILFFFVAHLLESSTVALELYFEHRNYLPAALMFWPLSLWLCGVRSTTPAVPIASLTAPPMALRATLGCILIAGLACMTWARADLWGNENEQALLWARMNPGSPRAMTNAALVEMQMGHPELAVARLVPAQKLAPNEVQIALNLLAARCSMGSVDNSTVDAALNALRTTRDPGAFLMKWMGSAIWQARESSCPALGLDALGNMLDAAQSNPYLTSQPGRRQDLYSLRGQWILARGGGGQAALNNFNKALDEQVRASAAFQHAGILATAGYPALALAHLDYFEARRLRESRPPFGMPRIHAWVLERQDYWNRELVRLRATLAQDIAAQARSKE